MRWWAVAVAFAGGVTTLSTANAGRGPKRPRPPIVDKDKDTEKDKDKESDKDKGTAEPDEDKSSETAKTSPKAAGDEPPSTSEPPVQAITPDEPVVTPPPPPLPMGAVPQTPVRTMDEMTVPRTNLRFGVNFFGDTSFTVSPNSPHTSFSLGALGIRLLGELSPSLDALAEFVLETVPIDGATSDVEQLAIRWRHGPGTLAVGRFHTEIGYWNTAYHHGLWLQTLIQRPHVVRFEDNGGLVPVHWVGAHYTLETDAGPGKFALVLGIGNGRGFKVDDVRVTGDTNDPKNVLVKVKYKVGGAEVGAGATYDEIARETVLVRPALPGKGITELLGNAYVAIRGTAAIVIAEGYAFRHIAGNQSWMTYAGFGVVGYAVTPWLTPYAAVDAVHGANKDPFFTPDPMKPEAHDEVQVIGGARFETSTWSALKLELRITKMPGESNDYAGVANWSFGL